MTGALRVAAGLAAAIALLAAPAPSAAEEAPRPIDLSSFTPERIGLNRPAGRRLVYALQARNDVLIRGIRARPRLCVECVAGVPFLTFEIPVPAESAQVRVERLALSGHLAGIASKDPRHHVPKFEEPFTWDPDTLRGVWLIPDSSAWLARIEDIATLEIPIVEAGPPMSFDLDSFLEERGSARERCLRDSVTADSVAVTSPPEPVKRSPPRYPDEAEALAIEGTVYVHALVSPEGKVVETRVLLSLPPLDEVAIKAAKRTRFLPAKNGEEPVEAWVGLPYTFGVSGP